MMFLSRKILALFTLSAAIAGCGGSKDTTANDNPQNGENTVKGGVAKGKVPAYFSGLAQQIQAADADAQIDQAAVFNALCGDQGITVDEKNVKNNERSYDFNCEQNGVKTTGTLVQTWNQEGTEETFKGTLKFSVVNPEQNAIAACQKLLTKTDTATCVVSSKRTVNKDGRQKTDTTMCGLAWDDFIGAFGANACKK